jgi:hypothetical protein
MIDAAERFQAIENVNQNGSLVHKILPSNVPQNGSLGDKILPSNESQVRPLTELSDAAAVVRMLASGVVTAVTGRNRA